MAKQRTILFLGIGLKVIGIFFIVSLAVFESQLSVHPNEVRHFVAIMGILLYALSLWPLGYVPDLKVFASRLLDIIGIALFAAGFFLILIFSADYFALGLVYLILITIFLPSLLFLLGGWIFLLLHLLGPAVPSGKPDENRNAGRVPEENRSP